LGNDRTLALVEPRNRRPKRPAGSVDVDDGAALRRHRYRRDARTKFGMLAPKLRARFARLVPKAPRVVFVPARIGDDVVVDSDAAARNQLAARVKEQCPNALRAVVDGQKQV